MRQHQKAPFQKQEIAAGSDLNVFEYLQKTGERKQFYQHSVVHEKKAGKFDHSCLPITLKLAHND